MEKVKEVKKITEEQLIGFLETQKHSLLHEYAGLVEDIEKYKKELEDIYGAININIEDGTYTDIEKE